MFPMNEAPLDTYRRFGTRDPDPSTPADGEHP
jgi:hypothetical protein